MAVYTSTTAFGQPKTATSLPATGTTTPAVDPLLLQPAVSSVLSLQAQQQELAQANQASQYTAAGASKEAEAYGTAAAIAGSNQATEALAEQVREVQLNRDVQRTVGSIKAGVAANGFMMGGSGLDIMKSSLRQGYLTTQLSALTSEQAQAGYLEQAAAANGEMAAAQVQEAAAESLAASQMAASQQAAAQAAALTGALTQLLEGDPNASKLVGDLTSGNTTGLSGDLLLYGQANGSLPGGTTVPGASGGTPGTPGATGATGIPNMTAETYVASTVNAGTKMIAPGVWAPVINPMTGAAFSGYLPI